ncbi:MAG: hypothetical protein JRK53_14885 [Deltaproteobacteria bacterium]|nr:hypothetical protein [Deltaproteobacteria bacterium]
MEDYTAYLRYFVGDPLEEIRQTDLDAMGETLGVTIGVNRIDNRTFSDGMMREETLDKRIEEITQDVIVVSSPDESLFGKAITALYGRYRSPRTPYGFWGSSPGGKRISREIADRTGGGW